MSSHYRLDKLPNGKHTLVTCVVSELIIALIVFGAVSASVNLPPMTLTIVGPDGTEVVLNETDIGSLTSYRAYGGYRTSFPSLKGLGNYTGVPINTFCEMVGGIRSGYSVHIIASDGYSATMSYEQANGDFITYDNVTGDPSQHDQTLTPILAYHYNDLNLTSGGPLRSAIVGPEGLCTDSTFWVKSVVRLEIHADLPPMSLTIVGSSGTELVLNEAGISVLPAVRAVGGRINKVGTRSGLGNYTGVPVYTFLNMVGGLHFGQTLRVTASDAVVQNFTYAQVNGDFATYDTTGQQVPHNEPLTTILAYHFNDMNLTSGGPLRFAIVGPEGLYTNSTYWVQKVVKLEILGTAQVCALNFDPNTLNLRSKGKWTTCYIELQEGFDINSVNVSSILLNYTVPVDLSAPVAIGDYDNDGTPDLMVKFDRSAVQQFILSHGINYGNVTLTLKGKLSDGTLFEGSDMIRVSNIGGDVNCDGIVSIYDIVEACLSYGSREEELNWNANANFAEKWDRIDIFDIVTILSYY